MFFHYLWSSCALRYGLHLGIVSAHGWFHCAYSSSCAGRYKETGKSSFPLVSIFYKVGRNLADMRSSLCRRISRPELLCDIRLPQIIFQVGWGLHFVGSLAGKCLYHPLYMYCLVQRLILRATCCVCETTLILLYSALRTAV
jgi:hypothetical protein